MPNRGQKIKFKTRAFYRGTGVPISEFFVHFLLSAINAPSAKWICGHIHWGIWSLMILNTYPWDIFPPNTNYPTSLLICILYRPLPFAMKRLFALFGLTTSLCAGSLYRRALSVFSAGAHMQMFVALSSAIVELTGIAIATFPCMFLFNSSETRAHLHSALIPWCFGIPFR